MKKLFLLILLLLVASPCFAGDKYTINPFTQYPDNKGPVDGDGNISGSLSLSEDLTVKNAMYVDSARRNIHVGAVPSPIVSYGREFTVYGQSGDSHADLYLRRTDSGTSNTMGVVYSGNSTDPYLAWIAFVEDGANDSARIDFVTEATGTGSSVKMSLSSVGTLMVNTIDDYSGGVVTINDDCVMANDLTLSETKVIWLNATCGIRAGGAGDIEKTEDGGATWVDF